MLKTTKFPTIVPTCFGSRKNHHQGAISCLAKLQYDSIVLVVNDVVCRHNIDHVINDEHNRIIIEVLAKHERAP